MSTTGAYIVTTEGNNALDLRSLCEKYVNEMWLPSHMTPDQAAESVLDSFKRSVQSELQLLEVKLGVKIKD